MAMFEEGRRGWVVDGSFFSQGMGGKSVEFNG